MKSKWNAVRTAGSWTFLPLALLAALLFTAVPGLAQGGDRGGDGRRISEKVKPFKIVGNIYYVGGTDMTIFLITTP
ncbi:MAG: hypothetical protein HW398_1272, partial [Acidobacteria bacterium]|nr:hypothetical protein [Acidobacteriota bacterium]